MSKAGKPEVRLPVCYGCPSRYHYDESIPLKAKGVMMHCGDVFCVEGKKARKFSRSDPKSRVPDWCPKRKAPCELRVYCFKNTDEWMMHTPVKHRHVRSWTYHLHARGDGTYPPEIHPPLF